MFKLKFFIKSLLLISPLIFFNFSHAELKINDEEYIPLSEAKWKVRPSISYSAKAEECLANHELKLVARLLVDTEGNVVGSSILRSSGLAAFDRRILFQLRGAKFYPFIKNGNPVKGVIHLPVKVIC